MIIEKLFDRLIPARAGNTIVSESLKTVLSGSSPLARGTLAVGDHDGPGIRLIPARAGNTHAQDAVHAGAAAHPRSRGEHWSRQSRTSARPGSSPLARGTPPGGIARRGVLRLIPARAGNTGATGRATTPQPAHPRSRGEHSPRVRSRYLGCGSSPLARGTRRKR